MTMEDERGWSRRFLIEAHLKVPIETMIMIATSAGIGIRLTRSPSTRIRNSRNTPATKVDSRPRPPDFTLMTDWPIMAQPAMPPKKPVAEVGDALADAFAVLVARGVSQLVDDRRRHQRFQQADDRHRRPNRAG